MLKEEQKFIILSDLNNLNIGKYYYDNKITEGWNVDEHNLKVSKKCFIKFKEYLQKNFSKIELLEKDEYIKIFCNWQGGGCLQGFTSEFDTEDYFPIITSKGKIFLENYDNSFSKKIDLYLGKYPNISKLFYTLFGILLGIIGTISTIYN